MARPTVTVIGDATLDVRAVPASPVRPGGDVPASLSLGPGGQGANIAVRLGRRGVATRLVCRLGPDPAGALVRAAVTEDGVELVDLGAPSTGTVLVLLDAGGERTMLSQRVGLLEEGRPPAAPLDTDWLVVSGYVLLERSAGIFANGGSSRRVIAGCSLEAAQADDWARAVRALNPHLVVLNVDEAETLGGAPREPGELPRTLGLEPDGLVIVTEPTGATATTAAGDELRVAADPGRSPVDTTGAGDAFTAALVAELLEAPWPPPADRLEAAMGAAAALAAAVTRVPGAQGRVPGEIGRA